MAGLVPRELPGEWHGRLAVGALDPGSAEPAAVGRSVGVVFQDPASQLVMERVADDVAFGLENREWARAAMLERVPDALDEVGLAGVAERRSITLSGGQQQRLALAGGRAPRPAVLVLDEPTSNLDPVGAAAFIDRLAELRRRRAATIVLVEHRVDLAWPLADLVLALDGTGRPIDVGPPDAVLRRSRTALEREGIWLPDEGTAADRRIRAGGPVARLPPGRPPLAVAEHVSFSYVRDRPVLADVSLSIGAGDRVALTGPNGSGKSTLGRLLVGLLRPTSGSIRVGGADPSRLPAAELARRAGYVFQDPETQFLASRVVDEVTLGLREDERARLPGLMASLGLPLESFGDRSPYRLSGGEQRRLSLACVLARRPSLLVLDEPTFGQDRHGYEALLAILRERVEEGTAVVAATHDERLADDLHGRRIALRDGCIEAAA
jgi:energy-coupling factor transport system ATP-binding protein